MEINDKEENLEINLEDGESKNLKVSIGNTTDPFIKYTFIVLCLVFGQLIYITYLLSKKL